MMRLRPLGATRVTELAFGAAPIANLYSPVSDADADAAIRAAWEGGIRTFDAAPHYGLGLAERRLGRALAGVPRAQLTVSTKVGRLLEPNPSPSGSDLDAGGFAVADDLRRRRDYSADGVRRSLEASLRRLELDRVDIVYVHDPEEHMGTAIREAVPALVALREQGLLGAIGVAMNLVAPLQRFVAETDIDAVLVAGRFTLIDRTAAPLLDECTRRGVAVVAAAPFNSGLLSQPEPPEDARFDYGPAPDDVLAAARECARVCAARGVELPQAALQFPLEHPAVASVLVGMRTAAEVRQSIGWFTAPLPSGLWEQMPPPARGDGR
jgi:D-threo-aldose 1-dehydrogenase